MTPLAQFLKSKHGLTDQQAERRAEWIIRRKAEKAAEKKKKLEAAQLTLGLDGNGPGEEPANKFQVDDPTVDF